MSFFCTIETDANTVVPVTHIAGQPGGNLALRFLTALDNFCRERHLGQQTLQDQWLELFEKTTNGSLCGTVDLLTTAVVSGEWDFAKYDYNRYLEVKTQLQPLSQEAYLASALHYQQSWTTIGDLKSAIGLLTRWLQNPALPDNPIYMPKETVFDFEAIHAAIVLAEQHETTKARLSFD